jgi:hypothetical protein
MKTRHAFLLVPAILLLAVVSIWAQGSARIYGAVRDNSGAVVAGAQIRVTPDCQCSDCPDPEKCKCCPDQITVTTGEQGQFSFNVPEGSYHLKVKGTEVSVTVHSGEDKALQITVE